MCLTIPRASRMPPQQSTCIFQNMDLILLSLELSLISLHEHYGKIRDGMVRAVRKFLGISPLFYTSTKRYGKLWNMVNSSL